MILVKYKRGHNDKHEEDEQTITKIPQNVNMSAACRVSEEEVSFGGGDTSLLLPSC